MSKLNNHVQKYDLQFHNFIDLSKNTLNSCNMPLKFT